jgi:F-type H+-transporting ATPase subunit delta
MEELIAKRYIKALTKDVEIESVKNMTTVFSALAEAFNDTKFDAIFNNPDVSIADKQAILLDAVKAANSERINNFIKLIVENKRISVIPAISVELQKSVANSTKTYSGVVYSDSDIDTKVINELSDGLSKRFDANISLDSVKNDFNGIKVGVESLGVEINFSKERIDSQIIDHIIKAI